MYDKDMTSDVWIQKLKFLTGFKYITIKLYKKQKNT